MKGNIKMRKTVLLLAGLLLMGSTVNAQEAVTEKEESGTNILIAYISRAGENYGVGEADPDSESAAYAGYIDKGNTQIVAEYIADMTGGDLYSITTKDPYPEDYASMLERAQKELDEDARPELEGELPDLSQYDTIFIGYPIWHGHTPRPVLTFLESYDLSGKQVIPFNTHEGSGQGSSLEEIKKSSAGGQVADGIAIRGRTAQEDEDGTKEMLVSWLDEMEMDQ